MRQEARETAAKLLRQETEALRYAHDLVADYWQAVAEGQGPLSEETDANVSTTLKHLDRLRENKNFLADALLEGPDVVTDE